MAGLSTVNPAAPYTLVSCLPALLTPAPASALAGMISSALELHRYAVDRQSRVVTALTLLKSHLFRYQGNVSAALVLGGFDVTGPHLHTVFPHGSTDTLPFATMGSGSLAAMSVFEADYREGLSREEACTLVARAIKAGIFNDLGSGSNVDLCVITAKGTEYLRSFEKPNPRTYARTAGYTFPPGTTRISNRSAPMASAASLPLNQVVKITAGLPGQGPAVAQGTAAPMDTDA